MTKSSGDNSGDQPKNTRSNAKDDLLIANQKTDSCVIAPETSDKPSSDLSDEDLKTLDNMDETATTSFYKVDLSKALEYRFKNKLSYASIGKIFNTDASTVYKRIKNFMKCLEDQPEREVFDNLEPAVCRAIKAKYLNHMAKEKTIEDSTAYHASVVVKNINEVQRLSEGKATEIFDVSGTSAKITELEKAIKDYEEQEMNTIDVTPEKTKEDEENTT